MVRAVLLIATLDKRMRVNPDGLLCCSITGQTTTRAGAGHPSPHRLMPVAASRLMTSARSLRMLWRDEQPNLTRERATERTFERAWMIWPLVNSALISCCGCLS